MKRAALIVAVAALCVAGSAMAEDRSGVIGSGTRAEDSGQIVGSGGFTMSTRDQYMGSGGRTEDDGQILGSGGLIGSGTRAEESGQVLGSGGLAVHELLLWDGAIVLIVSSDEGMFVILIEQ